MALELVTGYWGQEHVTAEQDADLNAGVVGSGMYVLPIGEKMRAEAVTSNKVRIFDGLFLGYGRQAVIEEGAYEDVEIENGTAGLLRNDMIIVKYAKDEVTGIEGVSFGVLKGQTGATAVDPVPNNQDIRSGTFESEMPLYRVKLNGLAIEAIQPLFAVPKSIAALTTALDDLNRNMHIKTYTDLSQIGLSDANTLQEICNVLPEKSILFTEVGAKPSSGWKSQLPDEYGIIRIEKFYISRVAILLYPINGAYFYRGAFSTSASPNLRPFYRYTGTAM